MPERFEKRHEYGKLFDYDDMKGQHVGDYLKNVERMMKFVARENKKSYDLMNSEGNRNVLDSEGVLKRIHWSCPGRARKAWAQRDDPDGEKVEVDAEWVNIPSDTDKEGRPRSRQHEPISPVLFVCSDCVMKILKCIFSERTNSLAYLDFLFFFWLCKFLCKTKQSIFKPNFSF